MSAEIQKSFAYFIAEFEKLKMENEKLKMENEKLKQERTPILAMELVDHEDVAMCKDWKEAVLLFENGIIEQIEHNLTLIGKPDKYITDEELLETNKELNRVLQTKKDIEQDFK